MKKDALFTFSVFLSLCITFILLFAFYVNNIVTAGLELDLTNIADLLSNVGIMGVTYLFLAILFGFLSIVPLFKMFRE